MEVRHLKKYLNIFFGTSIFLIVLCSGGTLEIPPAHAFFENQIRYAFEHRWLPMLSDSASEKRFQAMQAFLAFPEWGLPVLRKSIISPESDSYPWQIAMLIGILGDSSERSLFFNSRHISSKGGASDESPRIPINIAICQG
jgi:hypothetical protein